MNLFTYLFRPVIGSESTYHPMISLGNSRYLSSRHDISLYHRMVSEGILERYIRPANEAALEEFIRWTKLMQLKLNRFIDRRRVI